MKRIVWFLLIAFCTALAQVQPADMPVTKAVKCDCCEDQAAGTCHESSGRSMNDCAVCVSCAPALNFVLPAAVSLPDQNPAIVSHFRWLAEKGSVRTSPPLLTPPRLIG